MTAHAPQISCTQLLFLQGLPVVDVSTTPETRHIETGGRKFTVVSAAKVLLEASITLIHAMNAHTSRC
jgi:hypothetical protein